MHKFSIYSATISADLLPILANFSCGEAVMDEILHSQSLLTELHTDNPIAYCVYSDAQQLVGFCIAGVINQQIELDGHNYGLDMIDVACLAVHKDFRYMGIGTAILNMLCEKANDFLPNATFLHVEALDLDDGSYSAVPFYQKYGFFYSSRSGQDAARMFYKLDAI